MPNLIMWMLAIPLVTAVVAACLSPSRAHCIRWASLAATLVVLVLAGVLAVKFAKTRSIEPAGGTTTFQPDFVPGAPFIDRDDMGKALGEADWHGTSWELLRLGRTSRSAIQFYVGIDGLNIWLLVLTALLMVSSVLASWTAIQERVNEFYAWLLILEMGMLGVFLAFDIILFYIFFELTLVPLFFLIGIWGGPQRRYAARKFFIYTLTGSVITLLGLLAIVLACSSDPHIGELTFSIPRLVQLVNTRLSWLSLNPTDFARDVAYWRTLQIWVFLALMAGFAIKVPLVPLHTWLPLAHVEAPTAGSVLLAGILLKIGAYGFMRLCLPLAPDASLNLGLPLISILAVIGIIYGALCALAQDDIKKLVAYSSVSHLGFCMLGMFALNSAGLSGSLLQMINHGLSTGALFLLVGMLYERYHTRMLGDYGGMGSRLHLLACFMVFFCLTSVGLPGLNGFVGEVLVLMGMYDVRPIYAILGSSGIVLGAWYLLTMLQKVFFGPVKEPHVSSDYPTADLNFRELAALIPIGAACVLIGVYPQPLLDSSRRDIELVASFGDQAVIRQASAMANEGRESKRAQGVGAPRSEAQSKGRSGGE